MLEQKPVSKIIISFSGRGMNSLQIPQTAW
jgi:hypothetical protein